MGGQRSERSDQIGPGEAVGAARPPPTRRDVAEENVSSESVSHRVARKQLSGSASATLSGSRRASLAFEDFEKRNRDNFVCLIYCHNSFDKKEEPTRDTLSISGAAELHGERNICIYIHTSIIHKY